MNDARSTFLPTGRSRGLPAFVEDSMRRVSMGYPASPATRLAAFLAVYHRSGRFGLDSIAAALALYCTIAGAPAVRRLHRGGHATVMPADIFLLSSMVRTAYVALDVLGLSRRPAEVFRNEAMIPSAMLVIDPGLIGLFAGSEVMGARVRPVRMPRLLDPSRPKPLAHCDARVRAICRLGWGLGLFLGSE